MSNNAFSSILEKRKADIVTAVIRLVDKVGITGLTTKLIAKEVGFVEGALYKHVDSKTGVFHIILDASAQSIEMVAGDIAGRGLAPTEALIAWFDFVVSFLEDYPGIYRILFSDGLYAGDRTLFDKFKGCMLDLKSRMRAVIEKGMESGEFRPDINPETMAVMYLGMIHTTFTLWTVFEERSRSYKETARPYFEGYMRSLCLPAGKTSSGEVSNG
ncbi:MAG: TetR/AcrR family transcriptional regulator [Acidobacteriota bacterium]|nr:TetR/AcrR family transcriptional regulator [Acidobacteriota bacterium]